MANLITIGESKYFKSKDIKVFPSSFRGAYKSGTSTLDPEITFDPEARLNTEANFILPRTELGKKSYIIEYNETQKKISFILGGYYFELLNVNDYLDEIKNKYIGLKLRTITLQDPTKLDSQFRYDGYRETQLLDSWEDSSDDILDLLSDGSYCFTGLKVLSSELSSEGSDAKLKLFLEDKTLNQEALLPIIEHGTALNTIKLGTGLIADFDNQTVVGRYNKNNADTLFEVGSGTDSSEAGRKNAFEVRPNTVIAGADTLINGALTITDGVSITGKATSARTTAADSDTTLVTKSYIDSKIGSISEKPPTPPAGDGDQYVSGISQAGAQVSSTVKRFESTVSSSSNNAPTAQAVATYVTNEINKLNATIKGGEDAVIQSIQEDKGIITATYKTLSGEIPTTTPATEDYSIPTVKAVHDYIKKVKDGISITIKDSTDTARNDAIANTSTTVAGLIANTGAGTAGTGKYIQSISQKDGKVTTTEYTFAGSINASDTTNAPTSKAVADHVATTVASIWSTDKITHPQTSNKASLNTILLDLCYPVGTIYTYYSTSAVTTCPLKTAFPDSEWTAIDAGRFLCAAQKDATKDYFATTTGGFVETQLKAHSHGLTKTSEEKDTSDNDTVKVDNDGTHQHDLSLTARAHDADPDTGLRSGNVNGGCHQWTFSYKTANGGDHNHKLNLKKIKTKSEGVDLSSTKGTNLPPYVAVYMWRRTS
jgi:hypothetical protein